MFLYFPPSLSELVCKGKLTWSKLFWFLMQDILIPEKVVIFLYIMTGQVPWINDNII